MRNAWQLTAAAASLTVSARAVASDGFGIVTFVLGVPLLLITCVVLGVLKNLAPSKNVTAVSIVVFVPTLLICLYLIPDALSLFRHGFRTDSWIGVAFFGLLPLSCLLFHGIQKQSSPGT